MILSFADVAAISGPLFGVAGGLWRVIVAARQKEAAARAVAEEKERSAREAQHLANLAILKDIRDDQAEQTETMHRFDTRLVRVETKLNIE